jgi:hypothetical protein
MTTDAEFEATLAAGTAAEDRVYAWLKLRYSFVQDMRYQTHGKGTGPRLEGESGHVILPDFAIYDRFKGRKLIDVKAKTSVYPVNGKMYFTVDDYKFRDYLRCVELMNADDLMLIFVYDDKLYFYDSADHSGTITFNNKYGKTAYLFEHDEARIKR